MSRIEILENIKKYLKEFNTYDQRGFEILYNFQDSDIHYVTKDTCLCTNILESVIYYARIVDDLTEEEKQELVRIVPNNRSIYLEDSLALSTYCQKLIEHFEEEEVKHPVLEIYKCYDFLFYTKDNYQKALDEYLKSLPSTVRDELMTIQLLVNDLSENYLKELFQVTKQEFAKAVYQNNLESVVLTLRDYSLIKEIKYNGTDKTISYHDSEIMRCLYNYNQPNENEKYKEIESYYLNNKSYYSYYAEMHRMIKKYKEYCKKL